MIKNINILRDLIRDTDHKLTVSSIIDNSGTWTIYVDNTYYLSISKTIEIDGLKYKVVSFEQNIQITVKGVGHTTAPTATSFSILSPTFKHGTPQMVNAEHSKIDSRKQQKYPFIWLVETQTTNNKGAYDSKIESDMPVTLMFFIDNDKANWLIADHYVNAIYPMLNEIDFIVATLRSRKDLFIDEFDYSTSNHVNFGEYILNKGAQDKIISDDISGVEFKADLEFIKSNCGTTLNPVCRPVTVLLNGQPYAVVESGGIIDVISGATETCNIVMNGITMNNTFTDGDTLTINIQSVNVTCSECTDGFNFFMNNTLKTENLNQGDNIIANSILMKTL